MKKVVFLLGLSISMLLPTYSVAYARDIYVNGYTRNDGSYVSPHYRTSPNSTRNDNYSTRGNINPYTGQEGTKPRDGYNSLGGFGGNSNSLGGFGGSNSAFD